MAASPIAPPPVNRYTTVDRLAFGEETPPAQAQPAQPHKKPIGTGSAGVNETLGWYKVPNSTSEYSMSDYVFVLSTEIIKEHPNDIEGQIAAFAEVYKDPFKNKYSPFKPGEVGPWRERIKLSDFEIIEFIRELLQDAYKESMRKLADKCRLVDAMVAPLAPVIETKTESGMVIMLLEKQITILRVLSRTWLELSVAQSAVT